MHPNCAIKQNSAHFHNARQVPKPSCRPVEKEWIVGLRNELFAEEEWQGATTRVYELIQEKTRGYVTDLDGLHATS